MNEITAVVNVKLIIVRLCFRATYGFEVQNPVEKVAEVPQRYSFDYQVQTPVVKSEPSTLQGLSAHVDRVVVQNQGTISDSIFC